MEAEVKHMEDEQLANGVVVGFYDESRRVPVIAGRLQCDTMP